MKLTAHDWKVLQLPLMVLAIALVLMGLLVGYTGRQADLARQGLERQQGELNAARQRFQTSGAEKDMIVKYMPLYLNLVRQGFIGEERRIEWIDALRTINQQNKLFGITYNIGAQETYKPPFSLNTGGFTLHRSVMKLEVPLLHEGDLLTIIGTLAAKERAPFMVRDCVITRVPGGGKNKFLPNLASACEIDWLTVTEPARTGSKP